MALSGIFWGTELAAWHMMVLLAVLFLGIARSLWGLIFSPSKLGASLLEPEVPEDMASRHPEMGPQEVEDVLRHMGAPAHVHEEASMGGKLLVNNAPEPSVFENELCSGSFFTLHRATHDKALDRSGAYAYGEYFLDKSRLWEARVQFRFKKPPKVEDLYFGVEIEEYVPMAGPAKHTLALIVQTLKGVVGQQVYHTVGDDPKTHQGEVERPAFMMPLWAFDQFIVTPEGDTPPQLNDPAIPTMGQRRSKRVREYRSELEELQLKAGPTYTFCFWGISKWLDKLNWRLRLPLSPVPVNFNTFCGSPPVHVVIYSLKAAEIGEKRHLQDRKNYYLDVAFWSSKCRPRFQRMESLLHLSKYRRYSSASTAMPLPKALGARGLTTLRSDSIFNFISARISCCAPFISSRPKW